MPIAFACACGKRFRVKDELAGRRTKCPFCGQALVVPAQTLAEPPPRPEPPAEAQERATPFRIAEERPAEKVAARRPVASRPAEAERYRHLLEEKPGRPLRDYAY